MQCLEITPEGNIKIEFTTAEARELQSLLYQSTKYSRVGDALRRYFSVVTKR